MNRVDFGRLVASLRKEHDDEDGNPWSQATLAREANLAVGAEVFSENVIRKIERGRRVVDQQTLLALATALQLTSGERKEFFLAASGVDNESIALRDHDPEEILGQLIERMKQSCLPAFIIDSYYDIVAFNSTTVDLLDLSLDGLVLGPMESQPFPLNMLRFAFSDLAAKHLVERLGEQWEGLVRQTMMLFRTVTLRYRSTDYFHDLLTELNRKPLFKRYWRDAYVDEKDHVVDNRHICFKSTKWGTMRSFPATVTALTTAGELHLCIYIPTTPETVMAFDEALRQVGSQKAYRIDGWPKKDAPVGKRLRPVR